MMRSSLGLFVIGAVMVLIGTGLICMSLYYARLDR